MKFQEACVRIEYGLLKSRAHAVEVVDDESGRRWRMDVRVIGDVHADDGRPLTYQGLSIAGILPRAEMGAVLLDEFKRASAQRKDDLLRASVFAASFVLTAAIGCSSASNAPRHCRSTCRRPSRRMSLSRFRRP